MENPFVNGSYPVIDVHRHYFPKQMPSKFAKLVKGLLRLRGILREADEFSIATVNGITSLLYSEAMDIDQQVATQDQAGVTKGLLSFSMLLEMFCTKAHLPLRKVARLLNKACSTAVQKYPDKLEFMAMVNPFHSSCISECEYCFHELGAKGISISTSWNGKFLDATALDSFWEYAQRQDVPIFLHPPLIPIGAPKMNTYKLEEIVGRPFDTTMTATRMIYSGVFDRYPKLKIILPHMGGALINVIGRLDFGFRLGYEGLPKNQGALCERQPSEYLRRNLYVDTMGFSPASIKQCIEVFGTDRILFGTDYPAVPISPLEHINLVHGLGLADEDEAKILWKNAQMLFNIKI